MQISDRGINFIKKSEGFRLKAYTDPKGIYTIGYGHTKGVTKDMVITKKQAEDFLKEDLKRFVECINNSVEVKLSQLQFDVLVSFCFNIGVNAFNASTLLKLLNKGNYDAVPAQLMRWIYANKKPLLRLKRRRKAEIDMWKLGSHLINKEKAEVIKITKSTSILGAAISGIASFICVFVEFIFIINSSDLSIGWATIVMMLGMISIAGSIWAIKEQKYNARECGI